MKINLLTYKASEIEKPARKQLHAPYPQARFVLVSHIHGGSKVHKHTDTFSNPTHFQELIILFGTVNIIH